MPTPAVIASAVAAPLGGLTASTLYLMGMQTDGTTRKVVLVQFPSNSVLANDSTGTLQIVTTAGSPPLMPMGSMSNPIKATIDAITAVASGNPSAFFTEVAAEPAARAAADTTLTSTIAGLSSIYATPAQVDTKIAILTAGSPDALNTFLEAYNRFLTDETAASAMNAAIAAEATTRAAAVTSEATTRASAITTEAASRVSGDAASQTYTDSRMAAIGSAASHPASDFANNKASATLDFGFATGNEGDLATSTVSASWVTSSTRLVCLPSPADSPDHSVEETLAEDIRFSAVNVIPGTSFDVEAYAPNGTWGRHNCSILAL